MSAILPAISAKIRSGAEGSYLLDAEPSNTPESAKTPGAHMADSHPTSLYRYYDKHRILLYVGVTGRGMSRNSEHDRTKPWWKYVDHQTVEHFDSRAEALAAEKEAILTFGPPFNVQHNFGHEAARAAYEAIADSDVPIFTPMLVKERLSKIEFRMAFDQQTGSDWAARVYRSHPSASSFVSICNLSEGEENATRISVTNGSYKARAYAWKAQRYLYVKVTRTLPDGPESCSARVILTRQKKPIEIGLAGVILPPDGRRIRKRRREDQSIDSALARIAEQHRSIDAIAGDSQ